MLGILTLSALLSCDRIQSPDDSTAAEAFTCASDQDCVTTCGAGAVNAAWWAEQPASDCQDGCTRKGFEPPRCLGGACVAWFQGEPDPHCTGLGLLPAPLSPEGLIMPGPDTTGALNVRTRTDQTIYWDGEACYIRRYGTINKDTPKQAIACPLAMQHPTWRSCVDGLLSRDEDGQCSCTEMSLPGSPASTPQARPVTCPPPALRDDVITVPPADHIGPLNPVSARHGLVFRHHDGTCIVDGPLPAGSAKPSGSWIHTLTVPCPDEMFEGCFRSILTRSADGTCSCTDIEGDPPIEASRPVPCPRDQPSSGE